MRSKRITSGIMAMTAALTAVSASFSALAAREHDSSLYFKTVVCMDYTLANDIQIGSDSIIQGGKPWEIAIASDGTPCYNVEPGKNVDTNGIKYQDDDKYKAYGNKTVNNINLNKTGETKLTDEQKICLQYVLLYGFSGEPTDEFYVTSNSPLDNDFAPKYIATQLLIWEVLSGQRENYYSYDREWTHWKRDFNTQSNGYNAVSEILDSFTDSTKGEQIRKYYEEYEQAIKNAQYVTFGLYANEDITAADGEIIPKDGLIEEISLSADITADFHKDLPYGKYYIKEITTDEHYILSDEKYEFEFSYQGDDVKTVEIKADEFENVLKRGSVSGLKVDADDVSPLANAVIGLFMGDETEFTENDAVMTTKSAKDGSFSFDDIPYGVYQVAEIKAPTGYKLTDTVFPVTIDEDGKVIEITIEDEIIRGNVEVNKYDSDTDEKLSGAEFTVYGDTNGNGKLDSNEKKVDASEVSENDESAKNAVDLIFDDLREKDPDHFAVRQYDKYKLAAKKLLLSAV